MPQMSPLLWSILFSLFSLMLIFSMIKIYFFSNKNISSKAIPHSLKNSKLNWLW